MTITIIYEQPLVAGHRVKVKGRVTYDSDVYPKVGEMVIKGKEMYKVNRVVWVDRGGVLGVHVLAGRVAEYEWMRDVML